MTDTRTTEKRAAAKHGRAIRKPYAPTPHDARLEVASPLQCWAATRAKYLTADEQARYDAASARNPFSEVCSNLQAVADLRRIMAEPRTKSKRPIVTGNGKDTGWHIHDQQRADYYASVL